MREKVSADVVLQKLEANAHWRIAFKPKGYEANRIQTLGELTQIVQETKVSLRGWDFPHYSQDDLEQGRGSNFVENWYSGGRHLDYWRFFQSGQFIYRFGVWEDDLDYAQKLKETNAGSAEYEGIGEVSYLDPTQIVWTPLEACVFLSRLAARGLFDDGVTLDISLRGVKGRVLGFSEPMRQLSRVYRAAEDDIPYSTDIGKEGALGGYRENSARAALYLLERFGFDIKPEVLTGLQEELLPPTKSI